MLHSRKEKTNKRISESEQQKLPNLKREKINWKKKIKRTSGTCGAKIKKKVQHLCRSESRKENTG